jgi:hypothetical protein
MGSRGSIIAIAAVAAACGFGCSNKNQEPTSPPAVCSIDPASVAFGSVEVGSIMDTTIIIMNVGTGVLSGVLKVTQQGTSFSVVGSSAYTLDAGAADTFTVRFEPSNSGAFVARIAADPGGCEMTCAGTGLVSNMTWTKITPLGTPPSPRYGHTAIYDPVRDRMVVFGGGTGGAHPVSLADLNTLSLAGTPTWDELTPTGPPTARITHSAIYDPVRDRMVVFGGFGASGRLNDTWALSLSGSPAWTKLIPNGTPPSARNLHTAIYDPVGDRMIVFGGIGDAGRLNDVWALSLGASPTWTPIAPGGTLPKARYGHTAVYEPTSQSMIVFGGNDANSSERNDLPTLSLTGTPAWTSLTPAGALPGGRDQHASALDTAHDRMLMFGGYDHAARVVLGDLWYLSLAGTPLWTRVTPQAPTPAARSGHSAIYDPVRGRVVIFGGFDGNISYFSDVWTLE